MANLEGRLTVTLEPTYASRRDVACEAIVVEDPETGDRERYEVSQMGRHADPELLREKAKEWFVEDHGDA